MSRDYRDVYRARLDANLARFDGMDGTLDWPTKPDGEHPLTDLLIPLACPRPRAGLAAPRGRRRGQTSETTRGNEAG